MLNSLSKGMLGESRDIPEQKNNVDELAEKTETLESFFSVNLDLLCIADVQGTFIKVNHAWAEILGYSVDYLEGRKFLDFVHPEDLASTVEALSRLGKQEKVLHFVNRYRCEDGTYRYIEWNSKPHGNLIYAAARDITAHIELEKQLADQKEQFELAIRGSNDGIWDWDLKSNALFISQKWKEQLGYRDEELKSEFKSFADHLHPEDSEAVMQKVTSYLNGELLTYDLVFRMLHKDGGFRWIRARGEALRDSAGSAYRMAGSHTDITEQHMANQVLAASEARYRTLMENAPFPIIIARVSDGILRYFNQRAKDQLGFSDETGIGMHASLLYQRSEERDGFIGRLRREGRVSDQELHMLDMQGRPYVVLMSASIIEFENEPMIMASINDISERKDIENALRISEEKYRLLTENTSDVIWVFNLDKQCFTYISPSIKELRGYTVEEAMAQTLEESMTAESVKGIEAILSKNIPAFLEDPNSFQGKIVEIQQPCKNGSIIWVEVSTKIRYDAQGEIEVVGVSRNIEERKRTDEQVLFLSYHDQLTGLFNRTYFEKKAAEEITRSSRYGQPLSMLLLDLDHFKKVNDQWGHPVGDEVLKATAQIINGILRGIDVLVRFGGEEFIVLMPETDRSGATRAAEKIRNTLEAYRHPVVGTVTGSLGVAERKQDESRDNWYKRLDDALYRAKENGRNRVEGAE